MIDADANLFTAASPPAIIIDETLCLPFSVLFKNWLFADRPIFIEINAFI